MCVYLCVCVLCNDLVIYVSLYVDLLCLDGVIL